MRPTLTPMRTLLMVAVLCGVRLEAQSLGKATASARTTPASPARNRAPVARPSNAIKSKPVALDSTVAKPSVRIVAATFSVNGRPGSLEVVGIPVPFELSTASSVRFAITAEGRSRIIGKTSGTIGDASGGSRSVFFTVAAPAASSAGRVRVANAEFSAPDLPTVVVPVELIVAPTHRVEFALLDQLVGVRAGDVFMLRGRVTNFGNQTDTARVQLTLPQGWRETSGATYLDVGVAPRESKDIGLRVWVPPQTIAGMSIVRVITSLHGAPISTNTVDVQIGGRTGGLVAGPSLALSAVSVAAPGASVATGLSAVIDGPLSDSVYVHARANWMGASFTNTAAQSGFSRAGIANTAPTLEISSPEIRFGLGLTGRALSELTGMSLMGTGAAAEIGRDKWRTTVLAMRPYTPFVGADTTRGRMYGARIQRTVNTSTLAFSASHLDEPLTQRQLDAVGGELNWRSPVVGELRSEVGYRRAGSTQGLGYVGELRRQDASGMLSLRVLHAPGGIRGYARATDEINALASRKLTNFLDLSGGYWNSGDQSSGLAQNSSAGWSIGPSVNMLRGRATISLAARGFDYTATGAQGGFGSTERQGSVMLDARHGSLHVNASTSVARLERTTQIVGLDLPAIRGSRADTRVALGVGALGGSFEVNAAMQQYGGESSAIPHQASVGARFDRLPVPLPFRMRPILLSGDVQSVNAPWSGDARMNSVTTARVAASAQLFAGLGLTLAAERNPYLSVMNGARRQSWMTTLRIDRTTVLPRLAGSTSGTIFRDLNANGRQEKNESGAEGVVIRCGALMSVTDSRGRFACAAGSNPELDARSLPMGWIAPAAKSGAAKSRNVGLITVEAVRVRVALDGLDSSRVSPTELQSVQVIARDSLGQAWMARTISSGETVFDALPPGSYTLEIDASAVPEPLRLVTANPKIQVRAEEKTEAVTLLLRGRETKVRVLTPSTSNSSAGASAAKSNPNSRSK